MNEKNKIEIICFVFVLALYSLLSTPIASDNENSRYNLVKSVVEDRSFTIDHFKENTVDLSFYNGHYYSDKPIGPALLAIPIYFIFNRLNQSGYSNFSDRFIEYLMRILVISLPSALLGMLILRTAFLLDISPKKAIFLSISYAAGTGALPYSIMFYGHQLSAALNFSAFYLLLKNEDMKMWQWSFILGLLLGFDLITEYSSLIAIFPLLLFFLFKKPSLKSLLLFSLGFFIPIADHLIYNYLCFGHPLHFPYSFHILPHRHAGIMGFTYPKLEALWGILFSPFRGIFFFSPFLLFFLGGVIGLLKKRRFITERLLALFIIVGYILMNSSLVDWEGGETLSPRYLVPSLPFFIFLIMVDFRNLNRFFKFVFVHLAVYSLSLFICCTMLDPLAPLEFKNPLLGLYPYLFNLMGFNLTLITIAGLPFLPAFLITIGLFITLSFFLIPILKKSKVFPSIGFFLSFAIPIFILIFVKPQLTKEQYVALGNRFSLMGKAKLALDLYDQAIQKSKKDGHLYYLKAEVYRRAGDLNAAKTLYQQSTELSPQYFAPYYRLGILAFNSNSFEDALFYFQKTIESKDDFAEGYHNLGSAEAELGFYDLAEEHFFKAIRINRAYRTPYLSLIKLYQLQERFEEANKLQLELSGY